MVPTGRQVPATPVAPSEADQFQQDQAQAADVVSGYVNGKVKPAYAAVMRAMSPGHEQGLTYDQMRNRKRALDELAKELGSMHFMLSLNLSGINTVNQTMDAVRRPVVELEQMYRQTPNRTMHTALQQLRASLTPESFEASL
jgi:hypothetical protein